MALFDKLTSEEEVRDKIDGYIDLMSPTNYTDAVDVVGHLLANHAVVVNISHLEEKQRLLDFVSGAILAIGGKASKISDTVYICVPKNLIMETKEPK